MVLLTLSFHFDSMQHPLTVPFSYNEMCCRLLMGTSKSGVEHYGREKSRSSVRLHVFLSKSDLIRVVVETRHGGGGQ